MPTRPMQGVIQHLRRVALLPDGAGHTDGQLLVWFLERRDEAAFEALVRRHGPMVMSVCRRLLRNSHDAEDAFQATFLVLVRKAHSIVPPERVANWLHGVAYHIALKARAIRAKRSLRERHVSALPEAEAVPQEDAWLELRPLLDQALRRLPEKYRLPILLCDLEGKPIKEAAQHLGWPQGTLAGRLARGRKMLAKRLARQGLTLSGVALATVLSERIACACVPPFLVGSTVKAARVLAVGQTVATGVVSASVAALMEGVMMTMLLSKFKTAVVVLAVLGMLASGGGLLTHQLVAGQQIKAMGTDATPANQNIPVSTAVKKEHKQQHAHPASGLSPVTPSYVVEPPDLLLVEAAGLPQKSPVLAGEHLVRSDGTIALGAYGSVAVAGRCLGQLPAVIADHLAHCAGGAKLDVQVNLLASNSKVFYLITKGVDGDRVLRLPHTGSETVVGALLTNGLALQAIKGRVALTCPSGEVLKVDWQAITQRGESDTNYLIRSGDRVIVDNPLQPAPPTEGSNTIPAKQGTDQGLRSPDGPYSLPPVDSVKGRH